MPLVLTASLVRSAAAVAATLLLLAPAARAAALDVPTLPQGAAFVPPTASFAFQAPLASDAPSAAIVPALAVDRELVTNDDYAAFVASTGYLSPAGWSQGAPPAGLGAHPVVQVSRADAEAYAVWRTSTSADWSYRLPSEAEWENAARGPASTLYPWGNGADVAYDAASGTVSSPFNYNGVVTADYLQMYGSANTLMAIGSRGSDVIPLRQLLSEDASGNVFGWALDGGATGFVQTDLYASTLATLGYTTSVGSFALGTNAYGLDDMAGNVWEWTATGRATVATTDATKATRATVRGGAWSSDLTQCTTAYRGETRDVTAAYNDVGFRLVASPR